MSPQAVDRGVSRTQIGPLVAAGCRIWTHPAPFDHSKLMTVDDTWCFIGSSNWDVRSLGLDGRVLQLEVARKPLEYCAARR